MTALLLGLRFLFAAIFVYTGLSKVAGRARFELVLLQLFGSRPFRWVTSRTAATAIAGYELVLAGLVGFGVPGSAVLLAVTLAVFAAVVFRAWRLHVDCGCFPDRRPSEVAGLARSAVLLGLAVWLAVAGPAGAVTARSALGGVGWALGLALATYGVVLAVRRLVRRSYPEQGSPRVVPAQIVSEILADRGRPGVPDGLADADGWVEVAAACGRTGLPVSTLMRELESRSRLAGAPLLARGSELADFAATSTRGRPVTAAGLEAPYLVALFSASCVRCPGHVPEVSERLRADGPGPERVLVVVMSAAGDDPGLFTGAFAELATVVVEEPGGPVLTAFATREFPAFYVVGADRTVLAAGHQIADLAEVTV